MRKKILFFLFIIFLAGCKVTNHIPADKKIYGGASLLVNKEDSVKSAEVPELKTILLEATRPEPNTMLFGFPYKVAFNFFLGKKKKDSGLKEWFRKRMGEDAVFIDHTVIQQNVAILKSALNAYGYFNSTVKGELKERKNMGTAVYAVNLNHRFSIAPQIISPSTEDEFNEDFLSFSQNFRFPNYFDLESIRAERQKMYLSMRNMGYFYFRPEYINILLDSTQIPNQLIPKIEPKEEIPTIAKRRYQINNIYLSIDTLTTIQQQDENSSSFDFFRGLVLEDPKKKFKDHIFLDAIAFRPGILFNNDATGITNKRLLSLGNFKSIQSQYNVVNRLDSTLIDVYYNLQTKKHKSLNFEANALSRSSGMAGSQLALNWKNNNTFKGAEKLSFGVNTNFEFQLGGKREDTQFNNIYRTGVQASLDFPRFLAPFIKLDPESSPILPKTSFKASYENYVRKGLYDLNSANAEWAYAWTRGKGREYAFKPFRLTFVKSAKLTTAFIDEIFSHPELISVLDNSLILGSGFEVSLTPTQFKKGIFSYRGGLDVAGSLLSLFDFATPKRASRGKIFNELYSQFVRIENDARYRYDFSRKVSWANRAVLGFGMPYGNSLSLPFVNQFYVGGNNSLRAFRARGVGPGSYSAEGKTTSEKFLATNTGDIKIELNTELRYKLNTLFSTAFFVDAGNIWMFKDPYIYDQGAVFSKDFIKEMAIGGGLGFRFDFTFFIFRIDVATPFRKPWLESSERWVFDQIQLGKKDWRKDNVIWNFAVGLPF